MKYLTIKEIAKKWGMGERKVTRLARDGRILSAKKDGKFWLVPETAVKPEDGRIKNEIKTDNSAIFVDNDFSYTPMGARQRVIKAFQSKYGKKPTDTSFTPYRICPLGAHIDHQNGKITGFAIDKGIHIAYGPKQNGIIEICSLQFPKRAQWHVMSTPEEKQGDWADHLRGVTIALSKRYMLRIGICAVIDGELPIGGLSSSAAVIITFLSALCKLNNIKLSKRQMIDISREAENNYVGVACGKLDQSCEVLCHKDSLLYLDMLSDNYELVPWTNKTKNFEFIIFFSGVERSLAGSKYNMRVDEAKSAAYALLAFAGKEYGKYENVTLRDVPQEIFEQYKDKLPLSWKKRAEHYYAEMERVAKGVEAFRKGDIEEFGRLCFESGYSSIYNWETGSAELIALYEIMTKTKGIYGGRFSGAGFKGCCMAIIDPDYEQEICKTVEQEYLKIFPNLKGKFSAHICTSADGVKL